MMTKKSFINNHNISQLCDALLPKLDQALEKSRGEEIEPIPHALSHQNAAQIIRRIYNEFQNEEILQNKFNGNFDEFFDYLLFWSYGLKFSPENNKPRFEAAVVEERQFVGKVDLFCLVNSLLDKYPQKYRHSPEGHYDDFCLENIVSTSQGELTLRASFSDYLWDNIFNDYDTYLGTDNKEICLFNRAVHAVASFIHTANPHTHYLHLTSEETKNPLATAILFEGSGRSTVKEPFLDYLVVEGVLGNFSESATRQDKETLYGFLWDSIKEYAHSKGIKRIFVNTSHSGNQIEPEEFVEHIYKAEEIKSTLGLEGRIIADERGREQFLLQKPSKVLKEERDNFFTHEFQLKVSPDTKTYTNKSGKGVVYHDEQYADLFYLWNEKDSKKWEKGSFFVPKGYAQGFEVALSSILPPHKKRIKNWSKLFLAGILGAASLAGYGQIEQSVRDKEKLNEELFKSKEEVVLPTNAPIRCTNTEINSLTINCMEGIKQRKFYPYELTEFQRKGNNLVATVQGVKYEFELKEEEEVRKSNIILELYNNFRNFEEIAKHEGIRTDTVLCREVPDSLDFTELSLFLWGCTGDTRVVWRTLDVAMDYGLATLEKSRKLVVSKTVNKAHQTKNPDVVLSLIDLFDDREVFKILKESEETGQTTETLVEVLGSVLAANNPYALMELKKLASYYVSKRKVHGISPSTGECASQDKFFSEGKHFCQVDSGWDVLTQIQKAAEIFTPDTLTEYIQLVDEMKEHYFVSQIATSLVNIVKQETSTSNEEINEANRGGSVALLRALKQYASLKNQKPLTSIVKALGVIEENNDPTFIVKNPRGDSISLKFTFILTFAYLVKNECVFERYKELQDESEIAAYTQKILNSVSKHFFSDLSYIFKPNFVYLTGLCEQR